MHSMKRLRLLALAVCVLLAPAFSLAQTQASFNIVTSNAAPYNPGNIYAVDVNNDGLTDIVADGGYSPSAIFVSINKGNGTFAPPVEYTLPSYTGEPNCIAAADFNNDGKVDLAVPLDFTNEIVVYLGNGDGTFQAPILTTVNLPSGYVFTVDGCAAADFNADGNIDFVAWTTNNYSGSNPTTANELYVFQGLGNGSFNATPFPALAGSTLPYGMQVFVGDYNGDGKADIAVNTPNFSADTSTINVLYGNNNFTFNDTTPYTSTQGILWMGSGDLNSDGITDLYALESQFLPAQLGIFYGNPSNTFSSYWTDTPAAYHLSAGGAAAWPFSAQLTMGDYNGDGRMDLAVTAVDANEDENVLFFLAGSSPGQFTTQAVVLPANSPWLTDPVAGLLSGSYLKPDVTVDQSNEGSDDTTPTTLPALLNTTNGYFGFCPYPHSGKGINVCAPGISYGNLAAFAAAADSFGKMRDIQLWVDGTMVQQQAHTWDTHAYFGWAGAFSRGTHQGTFLAYDVDNTVQRYNFTFEVK
jgi:hypothetical protein